VKVLITGANGQLATEFQTYLEKREPRQAVALGREQLDVSDSRMVSEALAYYKPDMVLNCSAYNEVDKAETDYNAAYQVNASGVKNLAAACKNNNALLVHYSTDYVFNGTKEGFYTEDDSTGPINKYGESKLAGEEMLVTEADNFLLFRVSWVFGPGPQNFFYKLSEWAGRNNVLKIVSDQVSVPTGTEDIVITTMRAVKEGVRGLFHLTNSGYASRYEVARYYAEKCGFRNLILPVSSDFFPAAARRPYFTAMSNVKISGALSCGIPDWRDAVDRYIKRTEK
jgi:dTDP-4-dehydrorhamnose reductase